MIKRRVDLSNLLTCSVKIIIKKFVAMKGVYFRFQKGYVRPQMVDILFITGEVLHTCYTRFIYKDILYKEVEMPQ